MWGWPHTSCDLAGIGCRLPLDQTCCGQPMANGGFEKDSTELAKRMEGLFEKYDYVVGPSASCVVFVKEHYPRLLNREEHACISSRIYEICEFLHDVVKVDKLNASFPHKVSIHNSCHGERLLHLSSPSELMIPRYSKLRDLLSLVKDLWKCSSLSGWTSVAVSGECSRWRNRRPSVCMGQDKVHDHMSTGAEYITGADSSCLMHMEGIIRREKLPIKTIHVVEILSQGL